MSVHDIGGDEDPRHRPIVSFAPRGGRMNDVQHRAWDAHAGAWLVERSDVDGGIDQRALFGRVAPLVLEIGPGMGDATAAMAAARPEIDVLAVEVYKPGIAQTFSHLARRGVTNVRVLRGDAAEVLRAVVAPGSLAEVWLFFPDPWPKRKHLKRRIVTPEFANLVASRLWPGGSWYLATDWEPYARQMRRVVSDCVMLADASPGARQGGPPGGRQGRDSSARQGRDSGGRQGRDSSARQGRDSGGRQGRLPEDAPERALRQSTGAGGDPGGFAPRPWFRPQTRFERRGLAENRAIFDLHAVRVGLAPESTT